MFVARSSLRIRQFIFGSPRKENLYCNPFGPDIVYRDSAMSLLDDIPDCRLGVDPATRHSEFDLDVRTRRYVHLAGSHLIEFYVRGGDHHVSRQHCLERIHHHIHKNPLKSPWIGPDPAELGVQIGSKGNLIAHDAAK